MEQPHSGERRHKTKDLKDETTVPETLQQSFECVVQRARTLMVVAHP